jgi:MFS family permease
MSGTEASNIYSIPYYCAAVMTPIFGFGIDKFGRRTLLLILCGFLLVLVNAMFFFMKCDSNDSCLASPIIG